MKKILIIVGVILIIVLIAILISGGGKKETGRTLPTPIPLPSGYEENYSNMNYLRPGKSTIDETIKVNGQPKTTSSFGSKTTLAYNTPNSSYENIAVFENGILQYALEYVYSSYRGFLSDYIKTYGSPVVLYSEAQDRFDWYLFLDKGIGIESSNNDITRVLYFIPQDKNTFLSGVGKDLGIVENPPEEQGEILEP